MGVICSHPQICCYSNLICKACPSKSYLCPKNCFELYPTVYCQIVAINYPIKLLNFKILEKFHRVTPILYFMPVSYLYEMPV